jgi:hypothetical protein
MAQTLVDLVTENPLLVAVLLLLLVPPILQRLRRQRADEGPPADPVAGQPPADPYEVPAQSSTTTLKGATDGIAWTLTSSVVVEVDGHGNRRVTHRSTRWEGSGTALPQGRYILLQAHPRPIELRPEGGQGFLGRMARKLGDMALDIYVSSHFGEGFADTVNLDGSETVAVSTLPSHFIRSNTPDTARRFLEGPVQRLLRDWKEKPQGFDHEEEVDLLGILIHDKGITAGCMTSMASEDEARRLADFLTRFALECKRSGIALTHPT